MIRFLLGFATVLLLVTGSVFLDATASRRGGGGAFLVAIAVVPSLAAWAALELACMRRPRKLFDARRPRRWRALVAGAITSVMMLVVFAVLVAFFADRVPTPILAGATTLLIVSAVAWCLPVVQPHVCPGCDYDLRGVWNASRCPECGRPMEDAQSADAVPSTATR